MLGGIINYRAPRGLRFHEVSKVNVWIHAVLCFVLPEETIQTAPTARWWNCYNSNIIVEQGEPRSFCKLPPPILVSWLLSLLLMLLQWRPTFLPTRSQQPRTSCDYTLAVLLLATSNQRFASCLCVDSFKSFMYFIGLRCDSPGGRHITHICIQSFISFLA